MYHKFVIDFKYVSTFQNYGDTKAAGVENRGQISHFSPL